jgi:hypothetical protein
MATNKEGTSQIELRAFEESGPGLVLASPVLRLSALAISPDGRWLAAWGTGRLESGCGIPP